MIFIEEDMKGDFIQKQRDLRYVRSHNLYLLEKFESSKLLEGLSHRTIKYYKGIIQLLCKSTFKPLDELTTKDIKLFLKNYQSETGIQNASLDDMRRVFSSFYNYLDEENIINKNPVRSIHRIKVKKKIKSPFTEEEIIRLQDSCDNKRDTALIDFLYSTGVRVSELCHINIEDVDFNNKELIVFGKGNKERIVYFDNRTKVHLKAYLDSREDNNDALFVKNIYPYKRLTPSGVEYICKEIGRSANVKHCHPHRFRRTLATRLIDRGMPIEQVQKLLGHTKIDTTLIYASVNQNNVKSSHEKYV